MEKEYADKDLRTQIQVEKKRIELALQDATARTLLEDKTIPLKKEIKSLKIRLTNALKQRDEWALKYANVMSKKNENISCSTQQIVVEQ
jgi:hypothetical protein